MILPAHSDDHGAAEFQSEPEPFGWIVIGVGSALLLFVVGMGIYLRGEVP